MKKSLGIAASLALVWSAQPASAVELLKNLRVGGQIDLQATSATNVTDFSTRATKAPAAASANNDRIGDVQTRVMVNLDWDLLDDVHSRVTLRKNDRTWGATGSAAAKSNGGQTIDGGGAGTVLGTIVVDEAYFKVDKVAGQADVTLGRQFYGSSGDLVIYYGPSDKAEYGMPVTSIDAARVDWNNEWLGLTGIAGKTTGNPIGVAAAADKDVTGVNIALKGSENYSGAMYLYNQMTHNIGAVGAPPTSAGAAGGKADMLYVFGLKLKLAAAGFWWRGEFDQDFGDNRQAGSATLAPAAHYEGYAFLTNLGYKYETENAGMFSAWGEFALGSGRQNSRDNVNDGFVAINSDYRPGSIYGRFVANNNSTVALGNTVGNAGTVGGAISDAGATSSAGLNNRVIFGGGLRMSPSFANKLVLGASYWEYRLQRFTKSPAQLNDPLNGNRHIGSEADVDLVWTHSENVAFATGWGIFMPGGAIFEANRAASTSGGIGTNPVNLYYFDTRVRF
jgi:hypothetical protein